MKGRLRKAKKAYKKGIKSPLYFKYERFLQSIEERRRNGIRIAMAGMATAFGALRIATIAASNGLSKFEKTKLIMEQASDTAIATQRAMLKE